MLHITNGDCTKNKLDALEGEKIVWCDVLHHGPAPANASPEEWRSVRAAFLASLGLGTLESCLARLQAMDEALESWHGHKEVVLWYEHDLFDQLLLIRLLDYFPQLHMEQIVLSCVDVGRHVSKAHFMGLGQLPPGALQESFQNRTLVTAEQYKLARKAWQAFIATEPREVERLLKSDVSALPFLKSALYRHLQEFPSVENGLSRTEQHALEAISEGNLLPYDVFHAAQNKEEAPFLGDSTFFALLAPLAQGSSALFKSRSGEIAPWPSEAEPQRRNDFKDQEWELTALGKSVLAGGLDWIKINGINKWRGGVHLHPGVTLWRWDEGRVKLVVDDRLSNGVNSRAC